jgi:hypothetical protein
MTIKPAPQKIYKGILHSDEEKKPIATMRVQERIKFTKRIEEKKRI